MRAAQRARNESRIYVANRLRKYVGNEVRKYVDSGLRKYVSTRPRTYAQAGIRIYVLVRVTDPGVVLVTSRRSCISARDPFERPARELLLPRVPTTRSSRLAEPVALSSGPCPLSLEVGAVARGRRQDAPGARLAVTRPIGALPAVGALADPGQLREAHPGRRSAGGCGVGRSPRVSRGAGN
jgi:hypothetical protein